MIATILLAPWFPNAAYAAAWGVLAGGVAQLLFILWAAARHGITLRIARPRWTPEIKEFFKALGATTLGTASITIAPFVDTLIGSFLATGSLTALYYSDRINQLPLGVLGIALGTVLLPEMSTRLAKGDRAGSDSAQNRAAALGLLLTLPFVAAFFLVPVTIMRGIFAHGAFDAHAAGFGRFLQRQFTKLEQFDRGTLPLWQGFHRATQGFWVTISIERHDRRVVHDRGRIFVDKNFICGSPRVAAHVVNDPVVGYGHKPR